MVAMLLSLILATANPADAIIGRWQGQSFCAKIEGKRTSGVWSDTIDGDTMKGTCVNLPEKLVVRNVLVRRVP